MRPSNTRIARRYLEAYNYNDAVGGTLSWLVYLGGDSGNWRINWQDEDRRSWHDLVRQIERAFKSIRTSQAGRVSGVTVRGDVLTVYFDYDRDISADDALYDAERALKDEIEDLSDRDPAYEWALHGSVGGESRSALKITGEAIQSGFDGRTASRKTAELGPLPRRKVVQMINAVIDRAPLKGVHRDEYWRPVQALWKAFEKAGIPFAITKSEYEYEAYDPAVSGGGPARKVWRFEVDFTNERGRPDVVYGQVVAAGAGPVDDLLAAYDVTAYAS